MGGNGIESKVREGIKMLYFADTICLLMQEKNGVGKANLKYFNVSHTREEEQPQYQHTMHLTKQQILSSRLSFTH